MGSGEMVSNWIVRDSWALAMASGLFAENVELGTPRAGNGGFDGRPSKLRGLVFVLPPCFCLFSLFCVDLRLSHEKLKSGLMTGIPGPICEHIGKWIEGTGTRPPHRDSRWSTSCDTMWVDGVW